MAHNKPWYQRHAGKILMACMDLPDNDHRWAYSAIIDMLNDRDRPIDDDATFICSFTSLSKRKWRQVRAHLLDVKKLIVMADGRLSNPQFERERLGRMNAQDRARELGRIGGLKSGEIRATQGRLNLESDDNQREMQSDELNSNDNFEPPPSPLPPNGSARKQPAKKVPKKCPINAAKTPSKTRLFQTSTIENTGKKRSPRAHAIARESLRDKNIPTNKQTGQTPPARTQAPAPASPRADAHHARVREGPGDREPDCLIEDDFSPSIQACCEAAGIAARVRRNPAMRRAAKVTVQAWQAAGINIRSVAIPAIKRELKRMGDEPANSLERFTRCVDKAQASRPAKLRRPPPAKAEFSFADEQPQIAAFRKALADSITLARYAAFAGQVVFTIGDREPGDRDVLWITPRNPKQTWIPQRVNDEIGTLLRPIAADVLHTRHVWDRSHAPRPP